MAGGTEVLENGGSPLAGGFEVHERGTRDPIALGGLALPFIGLANWLPALHKLGREQ
jgi:hypothetical protein